MTLHIVRNPDILPDLEIRDENDNLVATIYNQIEGDPSDPSLFVAELFVQEFNKNPLAELVPPIGHPPSPPLAN
jgi:hypothetical protein